jgi:iron-sulfur cluster repair protein YtfE (RIC family)
MSTTEVLHRHHKRCDDLFVAAEEAAHAGQWAACADSFRRFRGELLAHFATEEEVLFPAFEERTGMVVGPTQVMRGEHDQMRALIEQMDSAQAQLARQPFAGAAETLLVLMQQHNMKEENILYPMCDRTLAGSVDVAGPLRERLEGL